jgi:hypothetical protein
VIVLRLVLLFGVLMIVGCVGGWMFTRNRRFLTLAWNVTRILGLLAIAGALLYVFERVLVF